MMYVGCLWAAESGLGITSFRTFTEPTSRQSAPGSLDKRYQDWKPREDSLTLGDIVPS
jgi:hypothetical protein